MTWLFRGHFRAPRVAKWRDEPRSRTSVINRATSSATMRAICFKSTRTVVNAT